VGGHGVDELNCKLKIYYKLILFINLSNKFKLFIYKNVIIRN
jgi:hypothetical protein